MTTKLTLILVLFCTFLANGQTTELCRGADTVKVNETLSSVSLFQEVPPNCSDYLTEAQCAAAAEYCVWELEEECLLREGYPAPFTPDNPLEVSTICTGLSEVDCDNKNYIGCRWRNGSACEEIPSGLILDQIIIDSTLNKFVLAESDYKYIFEENGTTGFSFVANEVAECPPVTSNEKYTTANSQHLYPNPAQNTLRIELDKHYNQVKVIVLDVSGMEIITKHEVATDQILLDVSSWASGTYQLVLELDGIPEVHKFIK